VNPRPAVLSAFAFALALAVACGSRPSATEAAHASLGGDTIARVGSVAIPASLVADVAKAERIPVPEALQRVVDDELAAAGARSAGLDKTPEVVVATSAAEARRIVIGLREAARKAGPPNDDEVKELTERHWTEVDLPEQMRVIHAVVIKDDKAFKRKPELEAEAVALASALATTEARATSEDDFEARAKALPHGELEVKVERLDPFVADGRRVQAPTPFDPDFVRAAVPLAVGATSGVVRSAFGWHVIRMVERLPEHRVPFEERRRLFGEEVIVLRAWQAEGKLGDELVAKYGVTISNGVEDLMTEGTMAYLGATRAPEAPSP
jgi:peptidyl-prolyl cis-trans isomerase C